MINAIPVISGRTGSPYEIVVHVPQQSRHSTNCRNTKCFTYTAMPSWIFRTNIAVTTKITYEMIKSSADMNRLATNTPMD